MLKPSLPLGLLAAVLCLGTASCTTLRRAGSPTSVEEVDMLADVELTAEEASDVGPAPAPEAGKPRAMEVAWTPSGKNIQLAKLPPVKPVTASMLSLGKRAGGPSLAQTDVARPEGVRLDGDAPLRGVTKGDPGKADPGKADLGKAESATR